MAESLAQSKAKRQKLSLEKDVVVDRIRDLAESLLCHIHSFLPTKQSVITTILSSTWNLLWTLVPKLDLDTRIIDASFTFETIVSKVLMLPQAPCLRDFRLKFLYRCSTYSKRCSNLEMWLRIAAARKVEELDIDRL
ncbi:F-box/LRR-repeat protein At3g59190-like [Fagus crenata]